MKPITLPSWMSKPLRKYVTRSGGPYQPEEVALAFALSIRLHNSADELRALAKRLVPRVCLERRPNMKRLARCPDDDKVFEDVLAIINRVCDMMGYHTDRRFER